MPNDFNKRRRGPSDKGMEIFLHVNEPAAAGEKAHCAKAGNCIFNFKRDLTFMFINR